jgi:hypothetical protein
MPRSPTRTPDAARTMAPATMPSRDTDPVLVRCEPLRSGFESSTSRSVLNAIFPLLTWSEELRLDLVFTGFALYYLLVQFVNIYRFNLFNYNVELLLLGGIVLSKRCIAALGCGVWAEVTVRFPRLAKTVGAAPASEQAIAAMGTGRSIPTVIKAGLLGPGLFFGTATLLHRLSSLSAAGPLQAGGYVFMVLFDFLLLFALDDPRTRAAKPGSDERSIAAATGDGSGEEVLFVAAGVVYSSVEAALVAGLAPTILADSSIFHFDGRHCHTITFYFFFSSAAFLLCHTLSSVVTDFQISTGGRGASGGNGSATAGGAGQLADVFAGNGDKIFAGLTFLRGVLAMWLITRLWDATHHWCFAALLLSGARCLSAYVLAHERFRRSSSPCPSSSCPDPPAVPCCYWQQRRVLLIAASNLFVGEREHSQAQDEG